MIPLFILACLCKIKVEVCEHHIDITIITKEKHKGKEIVLLQEDIYNNPIS